MLIVIYVLYYMCVVSNDRETTNNGMGNLETPPMNGSNQTILIENGNISNSMSHEFLNSAFTIIIINYTFILVFIIYISEP